MSYTALLCIISEHVVAKNITESVIVRIGTEIIDLQSIKEKYQLCSEAKVEEIDHELLEKLLQELEFNLLMKVLSQKAYERGRIKLSEEEKYLIDAKYNYGITSVSLGKSKEDIPEEVKDYWKKEIMDPFIKKHYYEQCEDFPRINFLTLLESGAFSTDNLSSSALTTKIRQKEESQKTLLIQQLLNQHKYYIDRYYSLEAIAYLLKKIYQEEEEDPVNYF